MALELATNQIILNARTQTGQRLDVTTIVGAEYILATPTYDVKKSLSDMTIEYIDHLGDNYLVVTLSPEESNFSGKAKHQLKVSFDGTTYVGCVLRPDYIELTPSL